MKQTAFALGVLLLGTLMAACLPGREGAGAQTDCPPPPRPERQTLWVVEAGSAVATYCRTVFIGSGPGLVGPRTGSFVVTDPAGALVQRPPQVTNGEVSALVADGDGGWVIGGTFTRVSGRYCPRLARIRKDGRHDLGWCPRPNGPVRALARWDGVVFAGGLFTAVGKVKRSKVAAVSLSSGVLPWTVAVTGRPVYDRQELIPRSVEALAISGKVLYIGGFFEKVAGERRGGIAAVRVSDGRVLPWHVVLSRAGSTVRALATTTDTIYFAGNFDAVNGTPRSGVAAVDERGRVTRWNPHPRQLRGFPGGAEALALGRDAIYVGGTFDRIGGKRRSALAAVDPVEGKALPFAPRLSSDRNELSVGGLAVDAGVVYAVGRFRTSKETGAASFDATTGAERGWRPRPDLNAEVVRTASGHVALGGSFSLTRGRQRYGLTAVDLYTGRILNWAPSLRGGEVEATLVHEGKLFVGGSFTAVNGQRRGGIAVFDARTRRLEKWRAPDIRDEIFGVSALGVFDDRLLIGGDFERVGAQWRGGIATLDLQTGELLDWSVDLDRLEDKPDSQAVVKDFAFAKDTVFVAGDLARVNGEIRHGVAALSAGDGRLLRWDGRLDPDLLGSSVEAIELNEKLSIGGWLFRSVGGHERRLIAALDPRTGALASQPVRLEGPVDVEYVDVTVDALALHNGRLYVGGAIGSVAGRPRQGLAALDPRTFQVLPWQPHGARAPLEGVSSIAVSGDRLVSASFGTVAVFRIDARPRS